MLTLIHSRGLPFIEGRLYPDLKSAYDSSSLIPLHAYLYSHVIDSCIQEPMKRLTLFATYENF